MGCEFSSKTIPGKPQLKLSAFLYKEYTVKIRANDSKEFPISGVLSKILQCINLSYIGSYSGSHNYFTIEDKPVPVVEPANDATAKTLNRLINLLYLRLQRNVFLSFALEVGTFFG